MRTCRVFTVILISLLVGLGSAWADVKLPAIFSDHMVLQRDSDIRVWGWADAGETVSVTLGDDTRATTANPSGQWQVTLAARAAGVATVLPIGKGFAVLSATIRETLPQASSPGLSCRISNFMVYPHVSGT